MGFTLISRADFTIGQNFTGSTYRGNSGFIPPDTNGAVGNAYYVELINGSYTAYRKSDGVAVQRSSLDRFWSNAGVSAQNFAFDPRIVYDKESGHWFAAALDNPGVANSYLVAVSNSADPTGGWKAFKIASDSTGTRWADFPTLGVNSQGVYIGANMFPVSGTADTLVNVLVLPKADLIAPTPVVSNHTLFSNVNPSDIGFSVQPVVNLNANTTLPETLISAFDTNQLKRSDITGSITSPTLSLTAGSGVPNPFVTLPTYNQSVTAIQPGGAAALDASDSRLYSSLVQQGNNIWGVQGVQANGHEAIRWVRLDATNNTLQETGLIASGTRDYFIGSIAVNPNGDVVIGFSGSDINTFASAFAVSGHLTGSTTSFDTVQLLKAGVASYEVIANGENRWGDYSSTTLDPNDSSRFWTIQEYASATNVWSTQVTEIRVGNFVPEPASWMMLGLGIAACWIRHRYVGKSVA